MSDNSIIKGLEHIHYFGPYELKLQLNYNSELDVTKDFDSSNVESMDCAILNLERILDILYKNRIASFFYDVFGIREGLLDKDKVAEEREKNKSKIYTIEELSNEVKKDLLEGR